MSLRSLCSPPWMLLLNAQMCFPSVGQGRSGPPQQLLTQFLESDLCLTSNSSRQTASTGTWISQEKKHTRGVNSSELSPDNTETCLVDAGSACALGALGSLDMSFGKPTNLNTVPLVGPTLPSLNRKAESIVSRGPWATLRAVMFTWAFPAGKLSCWQNCHEMRFTCQANRNRVTPFSTEGIAETNI